MERLARSIFLYVNLMIATRLILCLSGQWFQKSFSETSFFLFTVMLAMQIVWRWHVWLTLPQLFVSYRHCQIGESVCKISLDNLPLLHFQAQCDEGLICVYPGFPPDAWWEVSYFTSSFNDVVVGKQTRMINSIYDTTPMQVGQKAQWCVTLSLVLSRELTNVLRSTITSYREFQSTHPVPIQRKIAFEAS